MKERIKKRVETLDIALQQKYATGKAHVLIASQSAGDPLYLDATTYGMLLGNALSLLKRNKEEGQYDPVFDDTESLEIPEFPRDHVFSNKKMQEQNNGLWRTYDYEKKLRDEEKTFLELLEEAITNEDGLLAYYLLKTRHEEGYQYENIYLVQLVSLV